MSAHDLLAAAKKLPWREAETSGAVISDDAEAIERQGKATTRFYGGAVVFESAEKADRQLIITAVHEFGPLRHAEAAMRLLLADDDMPNHWDDCACSYCVAQRELRSALAKLDAARSGT